MKLQAKKLSTGRSESRRDRVPNRSVGLVHSQVECDAALPDPGFTYEWWRPTLGHPIPPTLPLINVAWAVFHVFRIFANQHYSVLFIRHGDTIVHRSCVLPRYFRWPFMTGDDLQITAVWTHLEFRRRGLAMFALATILKRFADGKRMVWYLTCSDNPASLRLSEAAGFRPVAMMQRTNRFGFRLLGHFRIVH